MKIKNLKIGTQLKFGLAAMLVFVILLGFVSYWQSDQIHLQTEAIYNHPLKTRRAINEITSNVLFMRMNIRDFLLVEDDEVRQRILNEMAINQSNVLNEIDKLKECYLGPRKDIDDFTNEFTKWVNIRQETIRLVTSGKLEEARHRHVPGGIAPTQALIVLDALQKISVFASNKSDKLYTNSIKLHNVLNSELILLVSIILLLSILINYILLRNIRKPLDELTDVTRRFQDGDKKVRSSYESKNEFGALSASFNTLARSIEENAELNKKAAILSTAIMSKEETKKFFQITLRTLSAITGSQMAAVYLLDKNNATFNHYESLGLDNRAKHSFAADLFEGEFGAVLTEKKIIHITQIPDDTPFYFPVVSGRFRPKEIITIPILEFDEVVAVISLASLHDYSGLALQLLHETYPMLTARIIGELAFKKIIDFSDQLDMQNKELEQQSKEMSMQADELKEYNIELELQKKQLDEANHLKSAFLSNMSHELRTPLNSVIALSGVLSRRLKSQIPEDEFSYLGIIEKNGKQLLELINDILDLSRIEAGKEEFMYSKFAIQDQIRSIVESLAPIAEEKGISIINHIPADLPEIISDSAKCQHIFQNIIGNAVKFTEKGSVEITAEMKSGKLYVGIKDTGIGILAKHLSIIFDEFRQADGNSSRKYGGTGLGLAIAKKYTQMLRGGIEVSSQEGVGSLFVVTLPKKPAEHEFDDTEKESAFLKPFASFKVTTTNPGGFGKTLLVVEDSEPQIIQLTDILKEEGYTLQIARNGKEALQIIQGSIPDAMILDLMMPEVDGFEVLKSIREQEKTNHIPVLILTAKHVTQQELNFLRGNHIYQLIQKGDINRNELLAHVNNMIYPKENPEIGTGTENHSVKQRIGKATILLIEDNNDSIITLRALLDQAHELITAADGLTGLEKAKTAKPDLILLDISLSGMDGFAILHEVKKDSQLSDIPVIALTARAMKGDREELLEIGFDDYISKPIDNDLFEKTIRKWLNDKVG